VEADAKLKGAPEQAGDRRKLGQVKRLEREDLAKAGGRERTGTLERGGSAAPRSKAPAEQTSPTPAAVPEAAPVPAPKPAAPSKLRPSP
jgi:hypothetical protein